MADENISAAAAESSGEPMQATPPAEPATAPEVPPIGTETAQILASEPLAPEPEPIAPVPEPQSVSAQSASLPIVVPSTNIARDLLVKARAMIQNRKQKKLNKILERITEKGRITSLGS